MSSPNNCNKCLSCVKHPACVLLLIWLFIPIFVFYLPSSQKWILALLLQRLRASAPACVVGADSGPVGDGVPSLPFAVQDRPPVVRPGQEPSLGGADGKVLVVAGGEEDVLPRRFGLHAQNVRLVIYEEVSGD